MLQQVKLQLQLAVASRNLMDFYFLPVTWAFRATPNILTMIFFQFVQLLNIYFCGNAIGSEALAGVGLGNMLLNVFIFALSQGLNGTVESFISWSLGQKDY